MLSAWNYLVHARVPATRSLADTLRLCCNINESVRSLSTVAVVPLTSNEKTLRFAGTFLVKPTQANGLSAQSVALAHQIRAIDESRIKATIGSLAPDDLQKPEGLLRQLLSL